MATARTGGYKHLYRRFLAAAPDELHFAAHSHHLWPDVTRAAHLACWDDAARWRDRKWEHLFAERVPRLQQAIAAEIGSTTPQQLVFGPNTHEFVLRLFSCLPGEPPPRVLTSDGEFHSFARQVARWEAAGQCAVKRLPSRPVETFTERLAEALQAWRPQLCFFSQVFFDSALVVTELETVAAAAPEETLLVIDGYHGFMALPQSLGPVLDRSFYLAGGYKYAQGGEGVCFLHVPPDTPWTPRNSGWFAALDRLEGKGGEAEPPADGRRFAGATFDPAGLYRLQAVFDLYAAEGIDTHRVHRHVVDLQQDFLRRLAARPGGGLHPDQLIRARDGRPHGHFLCFERGDAAASLVAGLARQGVRVDRRGGRLRIGFGLYQDPDDVAALIERLAGIS